MGRVAQLMQGSSPRLRGTHAGAELHQRLPGIIPALAGNTLGFSKIMHTRRDHPRACGEHSNSPFPPHPHRGSSPRLRGTRAVGRMRYGRGGIIPALAGNTELKYVLMADAGDHPRACGEHGGAAHAAGDRLGSSPRLRGTHQRVVRVDDTDRIIPALAGNTHYEIPIIPTYQKEEKTVFLHFFSSWSQ